MQKIIIMLSIALRFIIVKSSFDKFVLQGQPWEFSVAALNLLWIATYDVVWFLLSFVDEVLVLAGHALHQPAPIVRHIATQVTSFHS